MASLSKIFIIGNVGRDPELRMTANGKPVCDFSVAVNRVSCWGRQAETAQQIVTKGRLVFVEGRFAAREWTDKENQKRISLEISADNFQMLDSRRERDSAGAPPASPPEEGGKFDPDEIPF